MPHYSIRFVLAAECVESPDFIKDELLTVSESHLRDLIDEIDIAQWPDGAYDHHSTMIEGRRGWIEIHGEA